MLCMDLYAGRSQESINGTCRKRLRNERSSYILESIMISYIGSALYKAFIKLGVKPHVELGVEPYVELYRELHGKLCAEPLYVELIFGFIFKGLIDNFM